MQLCSREFRANRRDCTPTESLRGRIIVDPLWRKENRCAPLLFKSCARPCGQARSGDCGRAEAGERRSAALRCAVNVTHINDIMSQLRRMLNVQQNAENLSISKLTLHTFAKIFEISGNLRMKLFIHPIQWFN